MRTEVLIVGAGPTGLAHALWLARQGVSVRIVDRAPAAGLTSRAFALHAHTLELYDRMGLAQEAIARGRPIAAMNVHLAGKPALRIPFGDIGRGLSPFPFVLILLQGDHEKLLIDHLSKMGVEVERNTEVLDLQPVSDGMAVRLTGPGGRDRTVEAAYVCGCDGAGSTVRELMKIGFPGGSSEEVFYVADVEAKGPLADGELHYLMAEDEVCSLFPMRGAGRLRLIGLVPEAIRATRLDFDFEAVAARVLRETRLEVSLVESFATYRAHQRMASHWRRGRVFLLGDAGHVHSPAGGQGMNAGIGDAANLGWKLAAVLRGEAAEALLDAYEPEGMTLARQIAATTDLGFALQAGRGGLMDLAREGLASLAPGLMGLAPVRRAAFQAVSQVGLNMRAAGTCEGRAGRVAGGDRLPWVRLGPQTGNYDPLRGEPWQVQVYGEARDGFAAVCERLGLPLRVFDWEPAMGQAGLARDAIYLVRPDGYVGYASPRQDAAGLERYLDRYGLRLAERATPG